MRNRYGYGGSDQVGASFAALVAVLVVVLIWLVVRAAHLVWSAFRTQPRNKALWLLLLLWLGCGAVFVLSVLAESTVAAQAGDGASAGATTLAALFGTAFAATTPLLLLVSRIVTATSAQYFAEPKEQLATKVLHRPWWSDGPRAPRDADVA